MPRPTKAARSSQEWLRPTPFHPCGRGGNKKKQNFGRSNEDYEDRRKNKPKRARSEKVEYERKEEKENEERKEPKNNCKLLDMTSKHSKTAISNPESKAHSHAARRLSPPRNSDQRIAWDRMAIARSKCSRWIRQKNKCCFFVVYAECSKYWTEEIPRSSAESVVASRTDKAI